MPGGDASPPLIHSQTVQETEAARTSTVLPQFHIEERSFELWPPWKWGEWLDLTHVIVENRTGRTITVSARLLRRHHDEEPSEHAHVQDVTDGERIRVAPHLKTREDWGFCVDFTVKDSRVEPKRKYIEGNRVATLTIVDSP
jgi:hypothetical protein